MAVKVVNATRTFNIVTVRSEPQRDLLLEALGRPGSSATISADEIEKLVGVPGSYRIVWMPDETPVRETTSVTAVAAAPTDDGDKLKKPKKPKDNPSPSDSGGSL